MRMARPVRRRLVRVNLGFEGNPGVLSDIRCSFSFSRNRATGTCPAAADFRGNGAVLFEMGDAVIHCEIPPRGPGPPGSFNVGRRGELASWRQAQSGFNQARRSVQITDGEKLNHERPARACRLCFIGDGAEPRNAIAEGYGGASGFYPRKTCGIHPRGDYAKGEASDIRQLARGVTPSSDVTDGMTSNNKERGRNNFPI